MRSIRYYLPLLLLLLVCLPIAQAQSSVDFNVGFGWAHAKSLGSVDNSYFDAGPPPGPTFGNPCTTASSSCQDTPALSNFMLSFGGNLMLWKHFGVGADVNIQPAQQTYLNIQPANEQLGTLNSRVTLYNFNGIYAPVSTKKFELQIKGGIGGANVKFYNNVNTTSSVLGNQNYNQYFGSANHFQVMGGVGFQYYLTDHIFIRPEVDVHWVHNFTQFGGGLVPEATAWIGYSIGDRQ